MELKLLLFLLLTSSFLTFGLESIRPEHVHLSLSSSHSHMNVAWWTQEPVFSDCMVEYGTSKGHYGEQVLAVTKKIEKYGTGYMHFATMASLSSKTLYYYRVGSESSWSSEFSFHSRPDDKLLEGDKVRILAYGDMGVDTNALEHMKIIGTREIAKGGADMVLHVGDLAYAFENTTKWDMWFEGAEDIAGYVPYMLSFGNRDNPEVFEERFSMPLDRSESNAILKPDNTRNFYYSFDYGWVHVTSTSYKHDINPGSPQYEWLENDLRQACARLHDAHDNIRWIIVIGHRPLYSSSNGHDGGDKVRAGYIEHMFVKYNVSLGIWGDDHIYERSYPLYQDKSDHSSKDVDGVQHFEQPGKPIHLLVGTGGIGLDGYISEDPPSWSAYRQNTSHGYAKLEATKNTLDIKFIRKNGSVADHCVIVKTIQGTLKIHWFFFSLPVFVGLLFFGRRNRFLSRMARMYAGENPSHHDRSV